MCVLILFLNVAQVKLLSSLCCVLLVTTALQV